LKVIKNKTKEILYCFMFGIFLIEFFLSMWMLYTNIELFNGGTHNLDLGQNMRWLNAEYGLNLHDVTNNHQVVNDTFLVILGNNQIDRSYNYTIVWSILSSITFMCLIYFSYELGIIHEKIRCRS